MHALPRKNAPHNTRALGKILLRIIVVATVLVCIARLKRGGSNYDDVYARTYLNNAANAPRTINRNIEITEGWSEPISGGIPWRIESDDIPYIVEYTTTKFGVVPETFPPRRGRDPNWQPVYKDPEATSVRFRLPEGLGIERAKMLLYSR